MAKLRLVGAVGIKVRPDVTKFREDVEKGLRDIPDDTTVDVKVDLDLTGVKRQLDKMERDESKRTLDLKIGVDADALLAAKRRVNQALTDLKTTTIPVKMDEPGLKKAVEKIDNLLAKSSLKLSFDPADLGELKRERQRIEEALKNTRTQTTLEVKNNQESLRHAAQELDDLIKERKAKIDAEANIAAAEAGLMYASRSRTVPFYVRINERSLLIAEGVLKSLAGINTLQSSGRFFESLVTNFDTIALKAASLATIVGSVTDAIIFMGSALLPIGEGIAESVGLLAFAPAAMASITAVALINIAAFDNFKKAIDGNKEAMAGLPPEAQRTAKALQGTWKAIQEPVQNSFWKGMGDAMATSFQAFIPLVSRGLAESAEHVGRFGAGVFRAFEKISLAGGPLEQMLSGLSGFFDNAAGAAEPLFNAINILGLRGSEFLPRFGSYLTDMSNRFNDWIIKADEAGRITIWMEQGVQSLKDMWTLSGGVIKMFQGITQAAESAGAADLHDVAEEFSRIGDMMNAEPFQSRMATIFEGGRAGASALNVGLKDLGTTIGKSSVFIAALLSQLGELGGQALSGVATAIRNVDFQNGIMKGLQGMSSLLETLNPSFHNMGTILGNLSTIAGGAFTSIGPVLNNIIDLLNVVIGTLSENLLEMIPNLMGMVGGLITSLSGPITLLANMLNGVLGFINSLPGPLASLATSMLAFVLLSSKIGPIFAAKPGGFLEKVTYDFQQADGARAKFQGGLKNIGSGLLTAVGGPWGLAIGALTTGLALAAQGAVEAKGRIEAYTASLDANTGAMTENTFASAAQNLLDKAGMWEDFTRGAKKTQETLQVLGKDFESTARIAAEGGPAYDDLMSKLEKYPGLTGKSTGSMAEFADAMGISEAKAKTLSQVDIARLHESLERVNGEAATGKDDWSNLNSAISSVPLDAVAQKQKNFNDAMGIFNDKASTADTRVRALKTALDILSGRQPDIEAGQRDIGDAMRRANGELQSINGEMKLTGGIWRDGQGAVKDFTGVIDPLTGKIDHLKNQVGSDMHRHLDTMTTDVLRVATQMKDAKQPIGDITQYLADQRKAFVDQGVAAGQSADVVGAAWDYMIGAKPDVLATTMEVKGAEESKKAIDEVKGKAEDINAFKAVAKLEGDDTVLGLKLAEGYTSLEGFNRYIAQATLGLDPTEADAVRLRVLLDLVNLANSNPTVLANMDPALLDEAKRRIDADLLNLSQQKPSPEVDMKTEEAHARLGTVMTAIDNLAKQKPQPVVDPQTDAANTKLGFTHAKAVTLGGLRPVPIVDTDNVSANNKLDGTMTKLRDVGNQKPNPNVNLTGTSAAGQALDILSGKLDPFNGKQYSFMVTANTDSASLSLLKSLKGANGGIVDGLGNALVAGLGLEKFANGGVVSPRSVKYFANGGVEQHVAQIARPSSVFRVWAEPETGGEAYIPLASSKRARSTAILDQVASQFGYNLTPMQAFAEGGVVAGGNSRNSGLQVHIDTFNQNANDSIEDVGRGIMRQARAAGLTGMIGGI